VYFLRENDRWCNINNYVKILQAVKDFEIMGVVKSYK
jgi:hypothetical protein